MQDLCFDCDQEDFEQEYEQHISGKKKMQQKSKKLQKERLSSALFALQHLKMDAMLTF